MKCPNCEHISDHTALVKCSHCGEAFERGLLEELGHLEYLQTWVEKYRAEIGDKAQVIQRRAGAQQRKLLKEIKGIAEVPKTSPVPAIKPEPPPPAPKPAIPMVRPPPQKPTPTVMKAEAASVSTSVTVPKPVAAMPIAPKPATAPRKPAAPPKPPRPPIDWRKVIIEAATSGALLRALLYLGAFMIVVSATVLVIRFWDQFHPVIQLLFIASVPLSFYAGGWALRVRLKLTQAGTVLTGIGALLVVVDFGAIYQLGGVGQNNGWLYWLIVSIFCTALYTFTAWRLEGEFFDYLPLISGTSVLFTFTRFLRLDLEWSVVSIAVAGVWMTLLASRYWKAGDPWSDFSRAARYLSQILIPTSVFYIIFSPGMPPIGQMMGFLFATSGYLVLAWRFPSLIFASASLGASVGTVVFAIQVGDLSVKWYSAVAAILALIYILISQHVQSSKINARIIQKYVTALNTTGRIMLGLAAAGGFVTSLSNEIWAGVIAMTLASLDLIICAYFFMRSRYTLLASGLFIAPFSMAIIEWFDILNIQAAPGIAWLTFAWSALALLYITLGAVLQKAEKHNRWLYLWAHILTPIAIAMLPSSYILDSSNWVSGPTLMSLGASISIYLISFILQQSGRYSSLVGLSNWLPYGLGRSIFIWPAAVLFPIWCAVAWYAIDLPDAWFGPALAALGLMYIVIGQLLLRHAKEYRLPFHVLTYLLFTCGVLISAADLYSLFAAVLMTVISVGILAYSYNRVLETIIASILFVWAFQLSLDILQVPYYAQTLGYALLASLAYIPIGIYLHKLQKNHEGYHQVPLFGVGYGLVVYSVIESVLLRESNLYVPWIGVAVPLVGTALWTFSAWYFSAFKFSHAWAWASVLTFTVTIAQAVLPFKISAVYGALACACLAAFYMLAERTLFSISQKQPSETTRVWSGMFHLPGMVFALGLATLGLTLSLPDTLNSFLRVPPQDYLPSILAQVMVVILAIASARLYQQRWQFFFEPFIAMLPGTVFFLGYGKQIFHQPLNVFEYALVWAGLGSIHVLAGIAVDRAKVRYAHGLYFGGYALVSWSVLWTLFEQSTLVWTLGLWILISIVATLLVHFHRHQTWDEFLHLLFGTSKGWLQTTARNAFQWLTAWVFPIWCVIFLREINVSSDFSWLGLVSPPLVYLGLALWLRRIDSVYAAPLISAAQFYTVIGLLITAPLTFGILFNYKVPADKTALPALILLQTIPVIFYSFFAWMFKSRGFAHVAAWLSIIAFSIAQQFYGVAFTPRMLIIPWLIWSAVLLAIGYTLDKNRVRYAHGPYLAGYALMLYALARSTEERITNIYALAFAILLALLSHLVVHFGRHHTFEDFINSLGKRLDETARQIISTIFLFFVSYAIPVLLVQILTYHNYPLAWQGVSLAMAVPLYIALGLLVNKAKPRSTLTLVPAWALYSTGYVLTAISLLFAFDNERLGTYVLILNILVYAASAYIFRQVFWAYLSTALTPIVALLILHQTDHLESAWVAWKLILLAYIYLGIGQFFDRNRKWLLSDSHRFSMPFYMPAFALSVIALVVSSSDKTLAIKIYSAAVVLYAISAWLFRQTLFLYLAAWLAAVPYYLAITLTPLDPRWYGLAWLPFIIMYIAIGRIFFHKKPLPSLGKDALVESLKHPAIPFYLLAYTLSIGMILLSYTDSLTLTLALSAGMILYLTSACLFRTPVWIYPGLFATHLALLTYFTIDPQGGEAHFLSYPFHAVTWLMALLGYSLSRWITVGGISPARSSAESVEKGLSLWEHALGHPWARPFYLFVLTDIIAWQLVALNGYETTITLAIGHTLLLAVFSILWMEGSLVYDMVCFGLLAVGAALKQAELPFGDGVAVFGGIGFGLYLLARVIEPISSRFKPLTVWLAPLTYSSIFLTTAAVIVNLPFVAEHMTANAASLAFAGALYITISYRERHYPLGYLGMALLEVAWAILLYVNETRQPQFYAIPAGLYFLVIAYLEMQLGRKRYAVAIEMLGLGVLLVTSFAQSLNEEMGLAYFVLLMIESLLVIWWGVLQKRKVPFFTGIGASAINIAAQVIILISVHDIHRVNRWLVAFGAGLIITGIAVIAELKREQLRARSRQLSEMLETWE